MSYEGHRCPICHGRERGKTLEVIVIIVLIISIVFLINLGITQQNNAGKFTRVNEDTIEYGKTKLVIPELELQIHTLINNYRQSKGLHALAFDPKLTAIAREHSKDMADRNFFAHESPEGKDPTARGKQVGYTCHKELGGGRYSEGIAENISQNSLYNSYTKTTISIRYDWKTTEELAQSTVLGWIASTGHRQNILTPTYDREGIGVAVATDNKVYITEDFC